MIVYYHGFVYYVNMKILAIETSCDETGIAILEVKKDKFQILSNIVSSQVKIHAKWGGVVPSLARREHIKNLPIVLNKALTKAKLGNYKLQDTNSKQIPNSKFQIPNIDLIAVVNGPGLEPALWTGITFAKELAKAWNKPLRPINHLEGHLYSVFFQKNGEFSIPNFQFPIIALLASGGHTELVLIKDWLKYKRLGQTRDDAAGEAFDKVAKMLNLGYPGGPEISRLAKERRKQILETVGVDALFERSEKKGISGFQNFVSSAQNFRFPRPMINSKDYDFSFSGLKTAVLYKIKELPKLTPKIKSEICYEFQQATIDVLISKTLKTAKEHGAGTIILAGGVSANKELRRQMAKAVRGNIHNSEFLIPNSKYTGDNAAMMALAAYFRYAKNKNCSTFNVEQLKADGNLKLS